jgi:hypothetical protein
MVLTSARHCGRGRRGHVWAVCAAERLIAAAQLAMTAPVVRSRAAVQIAAPTL